MHRSTTIFGIDFYVLEFVWKVLWLMLLLLLKIEMHVFSDENIAWICEEICDNEFSNVT